MTDFQFLQVNGVKLRVAISGPTDGALVILVHGFPESWYSWRHQISALAEAGYRVAAPDVRGYGGSQQPDEIEAYSMQNMAGDIAGIARTLSPSAPVVLIGHDWGAPIVWNTALIHPGDIKAVAGLSIPHSPVGKYNILDVTKRTFIDRDMFFYLHYFQPPGQAEAEFEADTATAIRTFYHIWSGEAPDDVFPSKPANSKMFEAIGPVPETMPDWFTPEDEAYYVGEFERAGWRGALNRYRNFERDHVYLAGLPSQIIQQPALFIGGQRDPSLIMFPGDIHPRLEPHFSDLRGAYMIEGCGHWVQQERPKETNRLLLEWLDGLWA